MKDRDRSASDSRPATRSSATFASELSDARTLQPSAARIARSRDGATFESEIARGDAHETGLLEEFFSTPPAPREPDDFADVEFKKPRMNAESRRAMWASLTIFTGSVLAIGGYIAYQHFAVPQPVELGGAGVALQGDSSISAALDPHPGIVEPERPGLVTDRMPATAAPSEIALAAAPTAPGTPSEIEQAPGTDSVAADTAQAANAAPPVAEPGSPTAEAPIAAAPAVVGTTEANAPAALSELAEQVPSAPAAAPDPATERGPEDLAVGQGAEAVPSAATAEAAEVVQATTGAALQVGEPGGVTQPAAAEGPAAPAAVASAAAPSVGAAAPVLAPAAATTANAAPPVPTTTPAAPAASPAPVSPIVAIVQASSAASATVGNAAAAPTGAMRDTNTKAPSGPLGLEPAGARAAATRAPASALAPKLVREPTPPSFNDLLVVGRGFDREGKHSQALEAYERALLLQPTAAAALAGKAHAHLNLKEPIAAKLYATMAVTADPTSSLGWIVLGAAEELAGTPAAAQKAYHSCAERGVGDYVVECRRLAR